MHMQENEHTILPYKGSNQANIETEKNAFKVSYWPAKPVAGTIVVILSMNTFIGRKIV